VCVIQQQELLVLAKPNPIGALFTTMVIVAFAFKLLDVIHIVVNIVTVNAFFIDWELVCYCNSVNRVCLLSCWNTLHYCQGPIQKVRLGGVRGEDVQGAKGIEVQGTIGTEPRRKRRLGGVEWGRVSPPQLTRVSARTS